MVKSSSISVNNQLLEKTTQNTVKGIDQCEGNIKFEDVSEKIQQCLPLSQAWRPLLDPFPSQTPSVYLSKEYKIDSFTIDDTWVPGTYRTWFFPQALFAIPQIADVIKHYRYFRADVQLDLRVASSAFHQGLGQLSFIPLQRNSPDVGITGRNMAYRWSACQPVDLSFSSQQSASLCVPYMNPAPYIDTIQPIAPQEGLIGCFIYSQITPYRVTADVGPFQVSVWAKFLNPIVAGPWVQAPIPQQSEMTDSSVATVQPVNQNTRRYVDPEALTKTVSNAVVSNNINGPLQPIVKMVGSGSEFLESAAQAVTSFFGLFDKPTSVAAPSPMFPQWSRDYTATSGLDTSIRLGQHPTTKLATDGIFPMETSHITMSKLAQVPMLHHIDFFNSTRNGFTIELEPNAASSNLAANGTRDYFKYVAAAHHAWRGSIKYRVKFVCGQFIKARVQVSVRFNDQTDTSGQIFTRVIEVNGETETMFTVPFLRNRYWALWNDDTVYNDVPALQFNLIDSVVGGSTADDPTVDVVIWRAAAEDIQFAGLRAPRFDGASPTKIPQQQTSLRSVFSKPFDSLVCDCSKSMEIGYCNDDLSTTVADAMKRYSVINLPPNPVKYWFSEPENGAFSSGDAISAFSQPFFYFKALFWFERGDLRFRLQNTSPSVGGYANVQIMSDFSTVSASSNGTAYTYLQHNPELQFEVPYISPYPYLPIAGLQATQVEMDFLSNTDARSMFAITTPEGAVTRFSIAAADNYVCGMLAPPPYCDSIPPPLATLTGNKT